MSAVYYLPVIALFGDRGAAFFSDRLQIRAADGTDILPVIQPDCRSFHPFRTDYGHKKGA